MGCWNETCGITNLPIMYHEKIALFVLKKNKNIGNRMCYSNDWFTPIFPAIIGEYDDYGGIESLQPNKLFDCFVKWVNKTYSKEILEVKEEYNPDTIEGILEIIEREEIPDLATMMVHYDVYVNLIEEAGSRIPYIGNKIKLINPTMRNIKFEQFKRYIKKYSSVDDVYMKMKMESDANILFSDFCQIRFLMDEILKNDDDIINQLVDLNMMNLAMSLGRKTYMPQTGAGSQSCEYFIQNIIGKFMTNKYNEYVNSDRNEDYENSENQEIGREGLHVFNPFRFDEEGEQ